MYCYCIFKVGFGKVGVCGKVGALSLMMHSLKEIIEEKKVQEHIYIVPLIAYQHAHCSNCIPTHGCFTRITPPDIMTSSKWVRVAYPGGLMFAPNRKTTCAKIRVHPQILILSCIAASFSSSISIYFPLPATIFGRSSEAPRVFSLQALQDYLGSRCLVGWSRISGVFSTEKNWLFIQGLKIMNILSLSLSIAFSKSSAFS